MKLHFWATAATVLALLAASPGAALAQSSQAADFIVALVNSEPITNAELQAQIKRDQAKYSKIIRELGIKPD